MIRTGKEVISASVIVGLLFVTLFSGFEAQSTSAASAEDQFTIDQTITSEISFATAAGNVTMNPSLGGLTGGTSTGETHVNVLTNDTAGYTMTIKASSSPAMQGTTQSEDIADYTPATAGIPDFNYSVPTNFEFAYTISASTTADLAQKFKDDTSVCNAGSADTNASSTCWYGLSTTATSTIVRSSATSLNGATTTIFFRLTVNPNTSPVEDIYRATTTFTATTN